MKNRPHDHMHSKEELLEMIEKMKKVSAIFYTGATHTGNHAFIEFCGLMNEYIQVCEATVEAGGDFTICNTHTGFELEFKQHHVNYLYEKLDCIYGPTLAGMLRKKLEHGSA